MMSNRIDEVVSTLFQMVHISGFNSVDRVAELFHMRKSVNSRDLIQPGRRVI